MPRCLIGLGSNLGDRTALLTEAIDRIASHPQIENMVRSNWHRTKPIGGPSGQGDFLNAAIALDTSLPPEELIAWLQQVERHLGRERRERWAARNIDLDLLIYGDVVQYLPSLQIPHPRMAFRRFVMEPAAEVAAEMTHPTTGWTIRQLLDHLISAFNYIALTGVPGSGKTELARRVAAATGSDLIVGPTIGERGDAQDENELDRELAVLDARAKLLGDSAIRQSVDSAISDFWLGQSLAYAATSLDESGQQVVREHFERLRGDVLAPKLLVLLRPDTHESLAVGEVERAQQFQDNLEKVARQLSVCPMLTIGDADFERAESEIVAALEAMR